VAICRELDRLCGRLSGSVRLCTDPDLSVGSVTLSHAVARCGALYRAVKLTHVLLMQNIVFGSIKGPEVNRINVFL
jgi:hypothetical protein